MNEGKGIISGYPQSMIDILGKSNIASVHGVDHKNMRGALLQLVNPNILKHQIIPKIDEFMRTHLNNWTNQVIDIQEKTKQVSFFALQYIITFHILPTYFWPNGIVVSHQLGTL